MILLTARIVVQEWTMTKPQKKVSTRKTPPKRGATADKLSVKEKKQQIRKQQRKEKRKAQRQIQQLAKQAKKDTYAAELRKKERQEQKLQDALKKNQNKIDKQILGEHKGRKQFNPNDDALLKKVLYDVYYKSDYYVALTYKEAINIVRKTMSLHRVKTEEQLYNVVEMFFVNKRFETEEEERKMSESFSKPFEWFD